MEKQFEVRSSVSSTGMKKKSTVHLHCMEEKEVQGDISDLKSAKGEFFKLKLGDLGLAEKAKTMGKSYALESKLILLPAGTSAGPTRDQGLGGQFRPQGLDQWRGGDLARGERQDQLRKDPQKRIDFALMRTRMFSHQHLYMVE